MTTRTLGRHLMLAVAWGCVAFGGAMMMLYLVPRLQFSRSKLAMAAAFIPYGIVAWALAAVLFLAFARGRPRGVLALLAAAALATQLWWARPYWPREAPQASGQAVRVLSLNMLYGNADPAGLSAQVKAANPDIIVLLEYTGSAQTALAPTGIFRDYPHTAGFYDPPFDDAMGTTVLSRWPVDEIAQLSTGPGQHLMRVQPPSGPPIVLAAAHPANMTNGGGTGLWRWEASALRRAVEGHLKEPLIVAGDLNAVQEQPTLRSLLGLGLSDAASQAGEGWQPTFPAQGYGGVPPMIAIDHVLVNDRVVARNVRTFRVLGTDHLGLVADLVVKPA